jgi:hypothetical protein
LAKEAADKEAEPVKKKQKTPATVKLGKPARD